MTWSLVSRNFFILYFVFTFKFFIYRFSSTKGLFTWREGAPANRATRGGLTSHTFLSKTHRSVYMLDRVARLPGAPCLVARGTRLGGVAFCHVNGSSQAISANRGEINRENIATRSEYFRSYHLPVLSAEQNNSQSEEINVIDKSQEENRPIPAQEAEIRWKKSFLGRPLCLLCLATAQKVTHVTHSLSRLGELHVKAGYVSTLLAG